MARFLSLKEISMKKIVFLLSALAASSAFAQTEPVTLTVTTTAFENGKPIPAKYAYCQPDGKGQSKDGGNVNPAISWSGAPVATKSFALIMVDPDVPAKFDDANKTGKTIAENFPRQNFYHWVLYDIPASVTSIDEGKASDRIIKGGKPIGQTTYGITGPNTYAKAYGGSYGGYDGPCPPWNDARLHHYHIVVYALDVPSLNLSAPLSGDLVEQAMKGHILAQGEIMGTYTQYPGLLTQ
jgi:Raf kinase inhibitor-like YbhB/YbcL family protein